MNNIYNELNSETDGKYKDCRFSSASFDGRGVVITVYTPDALSGADAAELTSLIVKKCAINSDIRVELKVCVQTAETVADAAKAFIRRFPFASSAASMITATDGEVVIPMHESMLSMAKDELIPRLEEYLKNRFIRPVAVRVKTVELTRREEAPRQTAEPLPGPYEVTELKNIVGTIDPGTYRSAAQTEGYSDCAFACGVISMITELMPKSRSGGAQKPYQKFVLYDGGHTLQCRFYMKDGARIDESLSNTPVIVRGPTKSERDGETVMTVFALASVIKGGPEPIRPAELPAQYKTVQPKPYTEFVQTSIFNMAEEMPAALKGAFVAFDFETTGLSVAYDSPTELGAVRIEDGYITETFHTLIDPQRPIPTVVSEKTGITDDMVKGKPIFKDVIPDFYRFSRGAALVGHNIGFDFPFLIKHANRAGYCFGDKRTLDTMGMAPYIFPDIESVALDSVLGRLGLINDNAHRALSDALATAKAFIEMTKMAAKKR